MSSNREVLHETRRAEQYGVEFLRGGCVRDAYPGHRARLRLPFRGRLDPRNAEQVQEPLRLVDHFSREPRGLHRLRARRREISDLDGLPPLPLRAAFDFTPGYDRARLEPRRFSVEDERGLDSRGEEIRGPIDDPGEMRRHAALGLHQGPPVRLAADGEAWIQRVETGDLNAI